MLGTVIGATVLVGTVRHFDESSQKPPYWQAAEAITDGSGPHDIVVDALPGKGKTLERALNAQGAVGQSVKQTDFTTFSATSAATTQRTVWVVVSPRPAAAARSERLLRAAGFRQTSGRRFTGSVRVWVLKFRSG